MKKFLVVFCLINMISCGKECQVIASTSCMDNSIYVCNSNNRWEVVQTCKNTSMCKVSDGLAFCQKNPTDLSTNGDGK